MSLFDPYINAFTQSSLKDDYLRDLAMSQQMQQFGGLVGALGLQQAAQQVQAVPPQPQPNPVLLLTGEDE